MQFFGVEDLHVLDVPNNVHHLEDEADLSVKHQIKYAEHKAQQYDDSISHD